MFDSHLPWCAHAALRPCRSEGDFSRPQYSAVWTRHGMCELISAFERRHVGNLPAFGFFRLPRGVPRKLLSEAYQSQMQVASVLNCWTSSSDISGYHAEFHEGHCTVGVGQGNGMGMARYVWISFNRVLIRFSATSSFLALQLCDCTTNRRQQLFKKFLDSTSSEFTVPCRKTY